MNNILPTKPQLIKSLLSYTKNDNIVPVDKQEVLDFFISNNLLYGTDLETALKNNLKISLTGNLAKDLYGNKVKNLDNDKFLSNIAHKLGAGLAGCASAKLKDQSCEAGAVGAIVGEMVGDLMTNKYEQTDADGNKYLTVTKGSKEYDRIVNTAKLTAGSIALLYEFDVSTAAGGALEAVVNNSVSNYWTPENFNMTMSDIDHQIAQMESCASSNYQNCNQKTNSSHIIQNIHNYGDMTVINVSTGILGYSIVVNNHNGNIYRTNMFEVNTSSTIFGFDTSINLGAVRDLNSIVKNELQKPENQNKTEEYVRGYTIDNIINGSSVGYQVCNPVCIGASKSGKNLIYTYGFGTKQSGISAGSLIFTGKN